MLERQKEEFAKSPVKFIVGFSLIFIMFFVCIYSFRGYLTNLIPNSNSIGRSRTRLVAAQRELRGLLNRRSELRRHRESFVANRDLFWLDDRDGDPFLKAQTVVSTAAKSSEVSLSSLGAARSDNISDGAQFVSLSIKGQAPFKQIVKFILELEQSHPKAYWKAIVLRPDNPRAPKNIVLNGTIQFIRITDKAALKLLFEKSDK